MIRSDFYQHQTPFCEKKTLLLGIHFLSLPFSSVNASKTTLQVWEVLQ